MVQYRTGSGEASGDGHSSSTVSWRAHRGYLAPSTVKRHKKADYGTGFRINPPGFGRPGDRWSRFHNNQHTSHSYNPNEEYDPRFPNDYEKVSKIFSANQQRPIPPLIPRVQERPPPGNATFPPHEPQKKLTGDEMLQRRLAALERSEMYAQSKPQEGPEQKAEPEAQTDQSDTQKAQPVALKMMEKMGWKEGEGLGRHRQGMVTPLIAKTTGKNSGVIVNAQPIDTGPKKRRAPAPEAAEQAGPKSRVSLIVLPGKKELDVEELEEIASEYGSLINMQVLSEEQVGLLAEDTECKGMLGSGQAAECLLVACEYETEEQAARLVSALNNANVMESQVRVHYLPLGAYAKL